MPSKVSIQVKKRFQRSVNLAADLAQPTAVRDFIVSPLALETLERVLLGATAADGNRAWAIIGPYGSGKSSFAAFLANLVSPNGKLAAQRRLKQSAGVEGEELKPLRKALGQGLLPVPIVGQRAPLAQVLLNGLEEALAAHWTSRGRKHGVLADIRQCLSDLDGGKEVPDQDVAELIVRAAQAVQQTAAPSDGLCLILDEFGKTLEWAALHPQQSDLYLLQLVAEAANRERQAPFVLLTIQHQGLDAYADRLSVQQQREWEKVAGRFEAVPYLESPRHLVQLVSESIESKGADALPAYQDQEKASRALKKATKVDLPQDNLLASFPLHPATALLLGPLFRLDLGQNERSLFSFLSSREPLGFQEFLRDWDPKSKELYRLPQLYDYLLANTRVLLASGPESRIWRTAEEALRRLPKEASAEQAEVIKTVALLSLAGSSVGLLPTAVSLQACLSLSKAKCGKAIAALEDQSILLFRQFKGSYQLWDGSDLDVGTLLNQGRQAVMERGNLARQISEVLPLAPFLGARHYLETGTLRSMECRFHSSQDHRAVQHYEGDMDGLIAIILPEKEALAQHAMDGEQLHGKPVLSLHLAEGSPLVEAIRDYLGAEEALSTTSELENDPIARRALEELRLAAWDRVQETLTQCFHGRAQDAWQWNGVEVEQVRNLSELTGQALHEAYQEAPHLHNELLNREHLSSAAAAARRELLERLLERCTEERLGMEGFPPELAMYRSVFETNGMHVPKRKGSDHPGLRPPADESPLAPLWVSLDEYFQFRKGERISLAEVYAHFAAPPYGIRAGIMPVLLFSYLLLNKEVAFLYEDGSFIPALERDHVQRFLSRPQTFEVQKLVLEQAGKQALLATAKALGLSGKQARLLPVVRELIHTAANLSSFARQTQMLSKEGRQLRAALFSARDPIHLLTEAIPSALGIKPKQARRSATLQERLLGALQDLAAVDQRLLQEIRALITSAFGLGALHEVTGPALRERAEAIDLEAFHAQPLPRLVLLFSTIEEELHEEWFQQAGLALVGKPVDQWRDEDLPLFRSVLFEAARQFAAAEAGSSDLQALAKSGQPQTELTSLAWLTTEGGYQTVVSHLHPDARQAVEAHREQLEHLAEQAGVRLNDFLVAALVRDPRVTEAQSPESAQSLEV